MCRKRPVRRLSAFDSFRSCFAGAEPVTIGALVHRFIELQRERWGTGFSSALRGTLGGDGDWAKESLAFGLMVENGYWGVYRLWSRPWLVTK